MKVCSLYSVRLRGIGVGESTHDTHMVSVHSIRELAKELVPYHVTSVALPAAKHLKSLAFDDSNFAAFREAKAIPAIVNALRAGSASPIAQTAADAI